MSEPQTALAAHDPAMLEELANKGRQQFLQKITLLQPLSEAAQGGDLRAGQFTIGFGDDAERLGEPDPRGAPKNGQKYGDRFRCVVGPWRPHALLLVNKEVGAESFDPASPAFGAIQEEALDKTKREGRAAMFGVDYLLFLPDRQAFAIFFFSKTARQAIPDVEKNRGKLIYVTAKLIEKKFSWWIPEVEETVEQAYPPADEKKHALALEVFQTVKAGPTLAPAAGQTAGPDGRPR